MMKLSDTQLVILTAACQRPDRLVLPLPAHLKGGAADKVIGSLAAKGLIAEEPAQPGDPIWRGDETLVVTDAAYEALGMVAETGADTAPEEEPATDMAGEAETPPTGAQAPNYSMAAEPPSAHGAPEAKPVRKTREGTKQEALITMLRQPEGASIAEIAREFGWAAHTVRGAIAGALKKKLGLTVISEKVDGRGRVYRSPADHSRVS